MLDDFKSRMTEQHRSSISLARFRWAVVVTCDQTFSAHRVCEIRIDMAPRSLPPAKKRKVEHDTAAEERIKSVEATLLDSLSKNQSLNILADLLGIVQSTRDAQLTSKAVYAAYRVFTVIIVNGKLDLGGDESARLVKSWLLTQLNTYVDFLTGLLKDEEKMLRVS